MTRIVVQSNEKVDRYNADLSGDSSVMGMRVAFHAGTVNVEEK